MDPISKRPRRAGILSLLILTSALGLGAGVVRAAEGDERIPVNIAAGNAAFTLLEWADQTGFDFVSSFDTTVALKTRAVSGMYKPIDALDIMIAGTGLKYDFVKKKFVSVYAASDVQSPSPASVRPPPRKKPPIGTARPEQPLTTNLEEVTVTGTYIPGGSQAGQLNLTLSSEDLEASGISTAYELIRTVPSMHGGGPSEDTFEIGLEASTNSGRGIGANLRGLDASSTLVLVNGIRLAPGGSQGAFIDLSNIPFIALDKVEIMSDGASALYGADAVGGVVNFLMKENVTGNEAQLNFGGFGGTRLREMQFGQLFGRRWRSGNGLLAFEYYEHDALPASAREQATSDLRHFGGDDFRSFNANPGTIVLGPMTWAIPSGQDGTNLTPADLIPGAVNRSDRLDGTDILPEQERWSAYGNIRQSLSDSVELFGDLLFTDRRAIGLTAAQSSPVPVTPVNPHYVNPLGLGAPDFPIIVNYNFIDDLGPVVGNASVMTVNGVIGLRSSLRADWQLTATGGYALEEQDQTISNLVNFPALAAALRNPDPLFAFNPFGDGSHTNPATIEAIRMRAALDTHSRVGSLNVLASGPLFLLPGGEAKLAVGVDVRNQVFETNVTAGGGPRSRVENARDVRSLFGEISAPLVGESNRRAGLRSLELSFAARLEEYSDFGYTATPRFGVTWSPVSGFFLRSTWAESLRAPTLYDLSEVSNVVTSLPISNPAPLILSGGNGDLREERATSWTFGTEFRPTSLPDFSLAFTYFDVTFRDRIRALGPTEFDFLNDPRLAERVILNPTPAQISEFCSRGAFALFALGPCGGTPVAALVDLRLHNGAYMRTNGIDVFGNYKLTTDLGEFRFKLLGTYILDYSEAPLDSFPVESYLSTQNNPVQLRLHGSATWKRRSFAATGIANYTDSYTDTWSVPKRHVNSWTTFDLNLAYQFGFQDSGTRISLNVENLFNDMPPFLNNSVGVGYDAANADLRGRIVSFRIRRNW
jgi:iron complex outermembrane receptor protein